MLARLTLLGFGGHADIDITFDAPRGWTEVSGRSGAGKTTLLEGAVFALLGVGLDGGAFHLDAIADGTTKASATLTTETGTEVHRAVTQGRSWTRRLTKAGEVHTVASDAELLGHLGGVGKAPDVARLVMVPMAWRGLLERDLGRPLRDLLTRLLPAADLRTRVSEAMQALGFDLRPTDALSEDGAKGGQKLANRTRDEARGALDAAKATAPAEAPEGPSADAVAKAREVLAAAEAWRTHLADQARHEERVAARARQVEARDAWRARRAELGERPAVDPGARQAHEQLVGRLEREHQAAVRVEQGAVAAVSRAGVELEAARAAFAAARSQGDTCPHCKRPGWTHAAEALAAAEAEGKAKRTTLEAAEAIATTAREATVRAYAALEAARERGSEVMAAAGAAAAYDASLRALGPEPTVGVEPTPPTPPTRTQPTPEQVDVATRILASAAEADGARRLAAQQAARATEALARAQAAFDAAEREAKRCEALVAVVRRVPSEIAAEQSRALGDFGPVALRFPPVTDKNTPAIEVLVNGRSWRRASTGELVLADLHLRAAVRRLAKLGALPIFVDRAQCWSGGWPMDRIPGPVVLLRTTDGDLTVRQMATAKAAA